MADSTASASAVSDADEGEFVIARSFDAPRDLVWKAFTEAERMTHWWGPRGFTVIASTMDLRPGGIYHYGLKAPDGSTMWGKFVYRDIAAPERLVLVNSFSNAAGEITRHPMSPTWPLRMLSTFRFGEEDGRTSVTITWSPLDADETERATFAGAHASMQQGWTGTFDQLGAYLAQARAGEGATQGQAQAEHLWLQKLVGAWTYEVECMMAPGQQPVKSTGREHVRSLGGLWTVAEGQGEMPGGGPATTIMTLGYDPRRKRFVGTFIGSMMSNLWVYEGSLDSGGKLLTLDTEGPSMTGEGMAKYQDTIAFGSNDERVLASRLLGTDGTWHDIMTARYRRAP